MRIGLVVSGGRSARVKIAPVNQGLTNHILVFVDYQMEELL